MSSLMASALNNENEEEEDFFDMLSKEEESAPPLLVQAPAPVIMTAGGAQSEPAHHVLSYDSDQESPDNRSPPPTGPDFQVILGEFYSKYNFSNLDKVPYLADKFNFRRWELWEQLSIKYRLSPTESRMAWIKFNVRHDGVSECARRLFVYDEAVSISDESSTIRKAAWRSMLGIDPNENQRDTYNKYVLELAPREYVKRLTSESSDIVRDIQRTHQELGFFQDEEKKLAMIEVLSVYTKLNGIPYVQGMNEIVALVYYTMRDESDAFWALNTIMVQLKDIFLAEADSTHDGIYSRIDSLSDLLQQYDYKLSRHFAAIDFPIATIAMRWVTTLLAMDLTLPDALRVWDVALQSNRPNHLLNFSVCLSLSYLLCMSEALQDISDRQACVEYASQFGKGLGMDVGSLIITALSVYAHESILRGRYAPNSDEPLLEALADVVGIAKMRVMDAFAGSTNAEAREGIAEKVSTAKSAVSDWFTMIASKIPAAPVPDEQIVEPSNETPETVESKAHRVGGGS